MDRAKVRILSSSSEGATSCTICSSPPSGIFSARACGREVPPSDSLPHGTLTWLLDVLTMHDSKGESDGACQALRKEAARHIKRTGRSNDVRGCNRWIWTTVLLESHQT